MALKDVRHHPADDAFLAPDYASFADGRLLSELYSVSGPHVIRLEIERKIVIFPNKSHKTILLDSSSRPAPDHTSGMNSTDARQITLKNPS
jgi:hypothetical protein